MDLMSLEAWVLFCATEAVLCVTPGPAVLAVVSLALSRGARAGLSTGLGILAANGSYFAISATSLGAILLASGRLFTAVQWAGAAYLIYLGGRMILRPSRRGPDRAEIPAGGRSRPFLHGLVTQGANPKALVFFTAILPQFIDPAGPVAAQILLLGVSSTLIEFAVLAGYVLACHGARGWARRPGASASLDRVAGALLIGAGLGLATLRRGA